MEPSLPSPIPPHNQNQTGAASGKVSGSQSPGRDLLASLYQNLPVLVIHMATDGTVLHANPEVTRVTGYSEGELVGKNFWGVLFPGRLFAQVPKFISAIHPVQALARDVAMTLRTRDGQDRTIAFSRFIHEGNVTPGGSAPDGARTVVCIGNDLTDRLLDADKAHYLNVEPQGAKGSTVDGDVVTPLAISPPLPTPVEGAAEAIQQVHEFLTEVETRVNAMQDAFAQGEYESLAVIAAGLSNGAYACGLLDFSKRTEHLRVAATAGAIPQVTTLISEIVTLCRPALKK